MAAKKTQPAKGKLRGRMPTKKSINLMIAEEGKIKPFTAILAILLVLVLAAAFSKFLVMDRFASMSRAEANVRRVQTDLDNALDALENIGDVDDTYAHYTLEDMTAAELGLVDRNHILALVDSIMPRVPDGPTEEDLVQLAKNLYRAAPVTGNDALDEARQAARLEVLSQLIPVPEYTLNKWSVTENLLTVEVTGQTLERLNVLARQIETSPIVDTCTLVTANKDARKQDNKDVWGRFIIYLQQADGSAMEAAEEAAPGGGMPNFGAVTQFVGGEVSQE